MNTRRDSIAEAHAPQMTAISARLTRSYSAKYLNQMRGHEEYDWEL